jgi:hypothetical protein
MPFPNEDNYFQEFESGPIIAGRQASRAGVIQIPRAASATPLRQKKAEPGQYIYIYIKNRP